MKMSKLPRVLAIATILGGLGTSGCQTGTYSTHALARVKNNPNVQTALKHFIIDAGTALGSESREATVLKLRSNLASAVQDIDFKLEDSQISTLDSQEKIQSALSEIRNMTADEVVLATYYMIPQTATNGLANFTPEDQVTLNEEYPLVRMAWLRKYKFLVYMMDDSREANSPANRTSPMVSGF